MARVPPVNELRWWDLRTGDRVTHFDYDPGTVENSGPVWVWITWDNPEEHLHHHTAAIARHLRRAGDRPDPRD